MDTLDKLQYENQISLADFSDAACKMNTNVD